MRLSAGAKGLGGRGPQLVSDLHVLGGECIKGAALQQHDLGFNDGFRGELMAAGGLKTEEIAGKMEGADLPAAIGEKLVGADRAGDHL